MVGYTAARIMSVRKDQRPLLECVDLTLKALNRIVAGHAIYFLNYISKKIGLESSCKLSAKQMIQMKC